MSTATAAMPVLGDKDLMAAIRELTEINKEQVKAADMPDLSKGTVAPPAAKADQKRAHAARIVAMGGDSKVNWITLASMESSESMKSPTAAVGEPTAKMPPAAGFPVTASHPIDGPLELEI